MASFEKSWDKSHQTNQYKTHNLTNLIKIILKQDIRKLATISKFDIT